MTLVLLRMAHLTTANAAKREITVANITTLQSLRSIIQGAFALVDDGPCNYEVLGCTAPGYRARLRDLIASGITQFRYIQNGTREQVIEITVVSLTGAEKEYGVAGSVAPRQP